MGSFKKPIINIKPFQPKEDKPKVEKEVKEDRSDYNCKSCGGDGLIKAGTKDIICQTCSGTGKV